MSKVTSKLQVTIPKALAAQYGIAPGDDIEWLPAGDTVRLVPAGQRLSELDRGQRLELLDQASARQKEREARARRIGKARDRGWTREELYQRGGSG